MESNYIKCSIPLPLNFVKQHGLQGLSLFFFKWFYIIFASLKAAPHFSKERLFLAIRLLQQTDHAWLTTCSIYLFSFQHNTAQRSTVYLASCIIHIVQKFLSSIIMGLKTETLPHNDKVSTLPELHSLLLHPHPTPHQSLA